MTPQEYAPIERLCNGKISYLSLPDLLTASRERPLSDNDFSVSTDRSWPVGARRRLFLGVLLIFQLSEMAPSASQRYDRESPKAPQKQQ
jgi:hypothetical protein